MVSFEWDPRKEWLNRWKHGVDFSTAAEVFRDPHCRILVDLKHGGEETRYFCLGKVEERVLTVRFLYRGHAVRIIGAGYWRKGRKLYEKKKKV